MPRYDKPSKEASSLSPLPRPNLVVPHPPSPLQRIMYLQQTIGNRAVTNLFQQAEAPFEVLQRMMKKPTSKLPDDEDNNNNNSSFNPNKQEKPDTRALEIQTLRERLEYADEENHESELNLLYRILLKTDPAIVLAALQEHPESTKGEGKKKKGETQAQKGLRALLKAALESLDYEQYEVQTLPPPVVDAANTLLKIIEEIDQANKTKTVEDKEENKVKKSLDECLTEFSEFLVANKDLLNKITIMGQPLCSYLMSETDNGMTCNNQFKGKVTPLIKQAISGRPIVLSIIELLNKMGWKPLVNIKM